MEAVLEPATRRPLLDPNARRPAGVRLFAAPSVPMSEEMRQASSGRGGRPSGKASDRRPKRPPRIPVPRAAASLAAPQARACLETAPKVISIPVERSAASAEC